VSEGAGEARRPGVWVDLRYHEMVTGWGAIRIVRRPNKRPRRVCPHGAGVTIMVDPETRAPRNIRCEACYPPEA